MASCNGKGFSHLAAVHLAMPLMPDDVIDLLLKFFFDVVTVFVAFCFDSRRARGVRGLPFFFFFSYYLK